MERRVDPVCDRVLGGGSRELFPYGVIGLLLVAGFTALLSLVYMFFVTALPVLGVDVVASNSSIAKQFMIVVIAFIVIIMKTLWKMFSICEKLGGEEPLGSKRLGIAKCFAYIGYAFYTMRVALVFAVLETLALAALFAFVASIPEAFGGDPHLGLADIVRSLGVNDQYIAALKIIAPILAAIALVLDDTNYTLKLTIALPTIAIVEEWCLRLRRNKLGSCNPPAISILADIAYKTNLWPWLRRIVNYWLCRLLIKSCCPRGRLVNCEASLRRKLADPTGLGCTSILTRYSGSTGRIRYLLDTTLVSIVDIIVPITLLVLIVIVASKITI